MGADRDLLAPEDKERALRLAIADRDRYKAAFDDAQAKLWVVERLLNNERAETTRLRAALQLAFNWAQSDWSAQADPAHWAELKRQFDADSVVIRAALAGETPPDAESQNGTVGETPR